MVMMMMTTRCGIAKVMVMAISHVMMSTACGGRALAGPDGLRRSLYKFCGLLLDAVNEEDLTDERVSNWVSQLMREGILEADGGAAASAPPAEAAPAAVEEEVPVVVDPCLAQEIMNEVKPEGYRSHYNPRTDKTMWISADGRSSYVTEGGPGHE